MKPIYKILLLSTILWANILTLRAEIVIGFSSDTAYVCLGEVFTITPTVTGGVAPYSFLWSNGDTTSFLETIVVDSVKSYSLSVSDLNGETAYDSLVIIALPECVWPGDANGDGVANNRDVLILGITFGETGMVRPDAHTNWIGQGAPAWAQSFGSGLNYVHADTDGDGEVDFDDFLAIESNYFQPVTNGDSVIGTQGVAFYIDSINGNYQAGDTINIPVYLGTSLAPADSIYGIAFSINYDPNLIDSGSVQVSYANSWLGNEGVDLAAVSKDFYDHGQIDIGITRIDHNTVNGFGLVADITVMIDDITGKKDFKEFVIELAHVSLIDITGKSLPVQSSSGKIQISLNNQELTSDQEVFQVYPNPTDGMTTFEVSPRYTSRSSKLRITDLQGRLIQEISNDFQYRFDLDLSSLPDGIYLAEWSNEFTKTVKKFAIK